MTKRPLLYFSADARLPTANAPPALWIACSTPSKVGSPVLIGLAASDVQEHHALRPRFRKKKNVPPEVSGGLFLLSAAERMVSSSTLRK